MALLALIMVGLFGILLSVAVMMECSTPDVHPARTDANRAATPGDAHNRSQILTRPRGARTPTENSSEENKDPEHICVG